MLPGARSQHRSPGGVSPLLRGIVEVLNGNNEDWAWCWAQCNQEGTVIAPLLQKRARGSPGFCDLSIVTQLREGQGRAQQPFPSKASGSKSLLHG